MGTVDLIRKVDVAGPLAGPRHTSAHKGTYRDVSSVPFKSQVCATCCTFSYNVGMKH